MTKFVFFVLMMLLSATAIAQVITVKSNDADLPISNVAITFGDLDRMQLSDEHGQIKLGAVEKRGVVLLRHPAYKALSLVGKIGNDTTIYMEERVIEIDEVVISANKWEQNEAAVPNQMVSISAQDIAYRNPQTAADMLAQTGKVLVQKSQMGGGSPMIRGFAANSLLIMLNGIRINNAIYRSGNLQNVIMLDPNLLLRSEIIFGPGSSVYGSDALGGVMNFQTLCPSFSSGSSATVDGTIMLRYASANSEQTVHTHIQLQNKLISNITGITYSDFGDLRMGSQRTSSFPDYGKRLDYVAEVDGKDRLVLNDNVNLQRQTAYSQYNLMNTLSFRISNQSQITHTFYFTSSSNIPRYDRLTQRVSPDSLKYAKWYYGPQKLMLNALTFSNFSSNRWYDGMKLIVSTQQVEESRLDRKFGSSTLRSRTEKVGVYALNIDFDKKINSVAEGFYGAEWVYNRVMSTGYTTNLTNALRSPTAPRYPDGGSSYISRAIYGSYKQKIGDHTVLTSGLRLSHISLVSQFTGTFYNFPFDQISLNHTALSGTLGVVAHPTARVKVSALFATGFRSPNVDDIGKVFDSAPGEVIVPNENLGPEKTYNLEVNFSWGLGSWLTLDGTAYHILLRGAMVRRPFLFNEQDSIMYDGVHSAVVALTNVGAAFVVGYSAGFVAILSPSLSLKAMVNHNTGRDTTEDVPLRHTTPRFGNLTLSYSHSNLKIDAYCNFQSARLFGDLAPSEQSKAYLYTTDGALGWYTLNLKSSYHVNKSLRMTVAIENLLDRHYRPYSSGISAPGINGVVSARYVF